MALYDPWKETEVLTETDPARRRLERVGRHLVKMRKNFGSPLRLKMNTFLDQLDVIFSPGTPKAVRPECATAACVVGHAYLLMPEEFEGCDCWQEVASMMRPPGYDSVTRKIAFFESLFGMEWRNSYEQAADRIAWFLETGRLVDSGGDIEYQEAATGAAARAGWS